MVVENDRAAGEKDEKVRVSGEAYFSVPLGMAPSIEDVVGVVVEYVRVGRKDEMGTVVMYSGRFAFSTGACTTTSSSLGLCAGVCCLDAATFFPLLRCHGALRTFAMAGNISLVAVAICGRLTGAWKAIFSNDGGGTKTARKILRRSKLERVD